jgi:multidrug efflux pump subunit AcrA (membrane-fusion protein)
MAAAPTSAVPVFPPGRYGRRRDPARQRRSRWITWALAGVVVLAGVGIAIKLFRQYTLAPYQVTVIRVSDIDDTGVTVTFEVNKPAGQSASCTVQAHTNKGREVGKAVVEVPAAAPDVARVTYRLATSQRPVTGEVPGCGPGR